MKPLFTAVSEASGTTDCVAADAAVAASLSASSTAREAGLPLPATTRRPSARETILNAAEAVVGAEGAARLTLDAVADRASVSKGGLLYHFPTKELLLEAMVDRHMQHFEDTRLQALDRLPPGPGRELKALILAASTHCAPGARRPGASRPPR